MGAPGKRTVSRWGYRSYIQSPEWRAVRERYWASKLPKNCYCCGAERKPGMHLHHRTYKNLGNERLLDLVPVCPRCHAEVHELHRSDDRWRRKGLWAATNFVARSRGGNRHPSRTHKAA
jgi:5-methylcytosine-specific restriction endonuclease McrA